MAGSLFARLMYFVLVELLLLAVMALGAGMIAGILVLLWPTINILLEGMTQ